MAGGLESSSETALTPVELMLRYLESLPQEFSFREEVRSPKFWKALRAEFLASLLLMIFLGGCGGGGVGVGVGVTGTGVGVGSGGGAGVGTDTTYSSTPSAESSPLPSNCSSPCRPPTSDGGAAVRLALAYCLTTATLIQCFGNVSGAQTNPAVTLSLLVTRYISPLRASAYVTVQLAGALAGALIVLGLTPPDWPDQPQVLSVAEGVTLTQAFGVEFLATFLVVVTTLAVLDPVRADVGCKALSIGLAYGLGVLFAVYWVGTLFGGLLGGFTYEFVHDSSPHGRLLHRSFRRKRGGPPVSRGASSLGRDLSGLSAATSELLQHPGPEDISNVSRH
ncbi:Neurogenic protein big brain [Amphibalanus amphitrite]|uniref:Neurogenic protein big brain n=1 Tax=Amphibalanus amphitrite TaxID=1232801 RepID=A0A6A4W4L9_AMPAM|nr:Neurogenic protein big brain [Amphibalanus amphitrite]